MLASVESESVVTTFYNMAGVKSIFFRAICFFAFEASPPPQKSISMIHFVPLFFGGVALHMITCPPPPMVEARRGAQFHFVRYNKTFSFSVRPEYAGHTKKIAETSTLHS